MLPTPLKEAEHRAKAACPNFTFDFTGYKSACSIVTARCKCGAIYKRKAEKFICGQIGCKTCRSQALSFTHEEFCRRVKRNTSGRVKPLDTYVRSTVRIRFQCKAGHVFAALPNSMSSGSGGCKQCAIEGSRTDAEDRFARLHPSLELLEKYKGHTDKHHKVRCTKCDFKWSPQMHTLLYQRSGCPVCATHSRVSPISIRWLEHEAKTRKIKIQHGRNAGEFKVPGTNFRVDGYNARQKLVFEFYGDVWHGNPKKYKPNDRPLSHIDRTAGEMYRELVKRRKTIEALGYTVVEMWESDWKSQERLLASAK